MQGASGGQRIIKSMSLLAARDAGRCESRTGPDTLIEDWLTSMGVTINAIHPMDGNTDKHFGSVSHNGHTLDAVVVGPISRIKSLLHTNADAEYELNEIISAETGLEKNDSLSGIFPLANGQIAIDGSIHNEIKIDDQSSVLDIYIQNGLISWPSQVKTWGTSRR
jgi:hypothetical protein